MKKLITLLFSIFAFIATSSAALNIKDCTEEEVRAAVNEALSYTNDNDIVECIKTNNLIIVLAMQEIFHNIAIDMDNAISRRSVKIGFGCWCHVHTFPKISEQCRKENGADVAYSKSIETAKRLDINMTPSQFGKNGSLEDIAVLISESIRFPEKCAFPTVFFEHIFKVLQDRSLKHIKKYLRSQGKSFVTKDGINPCEKYMNSLNSALNAPRLSGLDVWFNSVGLNGMDLSGLPSESEVEKLKNDLLNGEVDMNPRYNSILRICLGVDGYNKFVKEYNGDNK